MVYRPELKYAILEEFSAAEVFGSQVIRPCFLTELLDGVSLMKYKVFVEHWLRTEATIHKTGVPCWHPKHHIVFFEMVQHAKADENNMLGQSPFATRILCATTHKMYLLEP